MRIQFKDTGIAPHEFLEFSAEQLYASDTTAFDWNPHKAALKPEDVSTSAWDAIFPSYRDAVGATVGSYVRALHQATEEAERYGVTLRSEAELSRYLVDRAVVSAPGASLRGVLRAWKQGAQAHARVAVERRGRVHGGVLARRQLRVPRRARRAPVT